ncbi:hypothetical protein [Archangium sp.]|uniref:hypothetical protein n=1 Tax=Archangium sp. TaxID=1872627 RepID=UPI00389A41BE
MKKTLPLLLCLLTTSCVTSRATAFSVPRERATECVAHCAEIDMKLAAVVIISNSAGCVCEPREEQLKASLAGAAAAVGGQMIQSQNAAQQQHQPPPMNP